MATALHEHADMPIKQRIVSAAGAPKLATSAPSSVFAVAQAAAPAAVRTRGPAMPPLDVSKIEIRKGVPIPPSSTGSGGTSPYKQLLERMQPGDSVELDARRAKCLYAAAKKMKVKVSMCIFGGTAAVWRLA